MRSQAPYISVLSYRGLRLLYKPQAHCHIDLNSLLFLSKGEYPKTFNLWSGIKCLSLISDSNTWSVLVKMQYKIRIFGICNIYNSIGISEIGIYFLYKRYCILVLVDVLLLVIFCRLDVMDWGNETETAPSVICKYLTDTYWN